MTTEQRIEEVIKEFYHHPTTKYANDAMVLNIIRGAEGYEGETISDWFRTTLTKLSDEVRKKERERLIEILERTKDRIDCDQPTCDTCNAAIARNAGLNSAISRVREK